MKKNYTFVDIKRGFWIHTRKILSDATLTILERTMYLAIILLLVWYRCQSHWSDGKHNAKAASQYKCLCMVFLQSLLYRKIYEEFKDLGILIDENLKFSNHVAEKEN